MDAYRHYIRVENGLVIKAFSSAFETPESSDILVEDNACRHYNPVLVDDRGHFIYRWENGQMVDRTQDPVYMLQSAKESKVQSLKAEESDYLQTFKSNALGTQNTYLSGIVDMVLLNGQYSFVTGPDYDGQPTYWYTVESGNLPHSKEQFIQVYLDGRNSVATVKYHRATLEAQVWSATTIEQVESIVW